MATPQSVETVSMFKCPETGKLFPTLAEARKSARAVRKEREKAEETERKKDYIRLNASTPREVVDLLVEKSLEFWGVKLEINSLWTHRCIGDRINFSIDLKAHSTKSRGWMNISHCRIRGSISDTYTKDLIQYGFNGFNLSNTRFHYRVNSFTTSKIELSIKISDFPLISEKHNKYEEQGRNLSLWQSSFFAARLLGNAIARQSVEVSKLSELIEYHEKCAQRYKEVQNNLYGHYDKEVTTPWESKNPAPEIDQELKEMFR